VEHLLKALAAFESLPKVCTLIKRLSKGSQAAESFKKSSLAAEDPLKSLVKEGISNKHLKDRRAC
jgi:hypothetical protein